MGFPTFQFSQVSGMFCLPQRVMHFHEAWNDSFHMSKISLTWLNQKTPIASLKIDQHHKDDRVFSLSQAQKIDQIVKEFSFHKGPLFYAPIEENMTPRYLQEGEDITFDPNLYRSLIGTLMHIPRRT
jgi:hypothetical protein